MSFSCKSCSSAFICAYWMFFLSLYLLLILARKISVVFFQIFESLLNELFFLFFLDIGILEYFEFGPERADGLIDVVAIFERVCVFHPWYRINWITQRYYKSKRFGNGKQEHQLTFR